MVFRTGNFLGRAYNNYYVVPFQVCRIMSLYNRLVKEKDRLGGNALRFPKTNQELLDRKRWERVYTILTRRYEYGLESHLDEMKRQDQIDEIATIKRTE